jgi:SAM-dependent methyltransferase
MNWEEIITCGVNLDVYIASLSSQLNRGAEGFWTSEITEEVSYPEDVRSSCAAIEVSSFWFAHRNRCIISLVRRFAPQDPILDIGGGNGAVSLALQRAGFPAIVVEPGPGGVSVARSRGLPVIQAAFSSLQIADGTMAAAGLFDVIEHIEDELGILVGLHRALADGGWLYLTVPAFAWLWSNEDNDAGHFRRYTIRAARRALINAGFEVAFASYMFGPLVLPVFLFRSAPSLFGHLRGRKRGIEIDHTLPDNALGQFIGRLLEAEASRIEKGQTIPFGSSVLLAARKRSMR